jgi:hypothetical protein
MLVNNMTTIDKSENLVPFLFMGCWNEDDTPRASVAKAIRENPIKTLVLGGDNIYPKKIRVGNTTDFTKVYNIKTLMNGVHMLHSKNIYTALGNHNISDSVLKTELRLKEWTIPDRYYCINFKDYSLVVIDSNLIKGHEYVVMQEWLKKTISDLESKRKKYYYVQHDPFISFKKNKKTVLPKLSDLLGVLARYPPIAILCADTHNYQQGTLKISGVTIPQFIVGTGGAHPDFVKGKNGDTYEIEGVTYTMDSYIPGYGYLQITDKDKEFIKVEDWRSFEGIGGKRRKGRTFRRKCKKSKKRITRRK